MTDNWFEWMAAGSWDARLTLTLMHFLWQACVIGVLTVIAERVLRTASATTRYALYTVTLFSFPICVAVTMSTVNVPVSWNTTTTDLSHERRVNENPAAAVVVISNQPEISANSSDLNSDPVSETVASQPEDLSPVPSTGAADIHSDQIAADNDVSHTDTVQTQPVVARLAPVIMYGYLAGVGLFLLRLTVALWGGHRLRQSAQVITDSAIVNLVRDQAKQLGLKLAPTVACCERVAVPTVVGVLRPMILLPGSLVTGLDPEQLAAIISHELAHIRRFDLLCNLLQRVIESLLFFHPVVWYISRRLSCERESCCDDMVVSAGYEPMTYAGALLRMAELCVTSQPTGSVAVAATGNDQSQLESRIHRLMTTTDRSHLRLTRTGLILATLMMVPLTILPAMISGVVQKQVSNSVDCALEFQIAVKSSASQPGEDINTGQWDVAAECVIPIRSDGGPGQAVSNSDGAVIRMSWSSVRLMNDGIRFEELAWNIENPIERRDGVTHTGIGGQRIAPSSTWMGEEFEWLAAVELDTMSQTPSDRQLVFRVRYLAEAPDPKPLNIAQLTALITHDDREEEEEAVPQPIRDPHLKDLPIALQVSEKTPPTWALENIGWDPFILPNHRVLAGSTIRDLKTGKELGHLDFGGDIPHTMKLSGSGRYLLTCRTEPLTSPDFIPQPSKIQVWDLSTLKQTGKTIELATWRFGLQGMGWSIAVSDDGKTVVAVLNDSFARRFGDNGVTVDPESGDAVPIEDKSGIYEWNMETGETTTHVYDGSGDPINAVALSPDGNWLVICDRNDLTYWKWKSDEEPTKIHVGRRIISLAFTSDSRYLAEGADSRRDIQVRDMQSLKVVRSFTTPEEVPLRVNPGSLKFSRDSKRLIAGNAVTVDERKLTIPHRIHVWDFESTELLHQIDARFRQTWSLDITPDGKWIAARLINLDKSMLAVWSIDEEVPAAAAAVDTAPTDEVLQEMHDLKAEVTRLNITRKHHRQFIEGGRKFAGTNTPDHAAAVKEIEIIDTRMAAINARQQQIQQNELGAMERVAEDVVLECSEEPRYGQPSYGIILYAKTTKPISANELMLFHASELYRTSGSFRPLATTGQGFYIRPNVDIPANQRLVVACIQDAPEELENVKNGFMPNSDRARDPNRAYGTQVFHRDGTPFATLVDTSVQNQGSPSDRAPLPGGSFDDSHPAVRRTPKTQQENSATRKGLEFLSAYPELREFSLEMTRQEFLDIANRHELNLLPPHDGTYSVPTNDGHVVLVMFGNNGSKCSGIQRLRDFSPIPHIAAVNSDADNPPWRGDIATSRVNKLQPTFGEVKDGLRLGLILHKPQQSYGNGDWVAFEYFIQNVGDTTQTIEIWSPTANGRVMEVTDSKEVPVSIAGQVVSFEQQPLQVTLRPNQIHGAVEGFQAGTRSDGRVQGPIWKTPAPGNYKAVLPLPVTVLDENVSDDSRTVPLKSPPVPFTITDSDKEQTDGASDVHTLNESVGTNEQTPDSDNAAANQAPASHMLQPIRVTTGAEKQPLANTTLLVRRYDRQNPGYLDPIEVTTNDKGETSLPVADGRQSYYFDASKPLPWLRTRKHIKFEPEERKEIHLQAPCRLTLRAVDSETGKGIPGVIFVKSRDLAEIWAEEVVPHTLGSRPPSRSNKEMLTGQHLQTDEDGYYRVDVGEQYPWTYWVWNAPEGYEVDRSVEVELETRPGMKVEYTFTLQPNRILTDQKSYLTGQPAAEHISRWKPNMRYAVGLCIVSRHKDTELVTNSNWLPFEGDTEHTKRDMVFGSTGSAGWRRTAAQYVTKVLNTPKREGFRFYQTAPLPPDEERPRFGQYTYREDGLRHMPIHTEANCFLNMTEVDDQHVDLSVNYLGLEYETPMGPQDRDPKDNALYAVMTTKPMTRRVRLGEENRFVLVNDKSRNMTKIAHIRVLPIRIEQP